MYYLQLVSFTIVFLTLTVIFIITYLSFNTTYCSENPENKEQNVEILKKFLFSMQFCNKAGIARKRSFSHQRFHTNSNKNSKNNTKLLRKNLFKLFLGFFGINL